MTVYTISRAFQSSVERTERVLEVAEAFGLGLSDKQFVVYDGLKLEVEPGDVVYITGQSGSGKSLLLRELAAQMAAGGLKVADIDRVRVADIPLIDQVGANTQKATEILSKTGVNDAYLFIRKPQELSDGQRYRFRLAKLIESDADVWVADEFGAVLDRTTAKVVAYNVQKTARALGKTLIVATTHTDLEDALGPSLIVRKLFRERVDVRRGETAAACPACGDPR